MKRLVLLSFLALLPLAGGCKRVDQTKVLRFATSADYPPFGYMSEGKIVGFEIDLARLVAEELGKTAVFQDMTFAAVLPALKGGRADVAIATITATEERAANYDFSEPYFHEELFAVFRRSNPLLDAASLEGKKLACQLGTTMEIWLRKNVRNAQIICLDNVGQAVEALKRWLVDGVVIDGFQAQGFCKGNGDLGRCFLARSPHGYAMAFAKNSPLRARVDAILQKLDGDGRLQELCRRWELDGTR